MVLLNLCLQELFQKFATSLSPFQIVVVVATDWKYLVDSVAEGQPVACLTAELFEWAHKPNVRFFIHWRFEFAFGKWKLKVPKVWLNGQTINVVSQLFEAVTFPSDYFCGWVVECLNSFQNFDGFPCCMVVAVGVVEVVLWIQKHKWLLWAPTRTPTYKPYFGDYGLWRLDQLQKHRWIL